MLDENIIAECSAIARSHFLYSSHRNDNIVDWYKLDGIANKASGICHYCTIDTLNAILGENCLRFTDIRFLNDSTEFKEIIRNIKTVFDKKNYDMAFKNFILNSDEMHKLEDYKQSYVGFIQKTKKYEEISYRTYTCSFSTDKNSLSM